MGKDTITGRHTMTAPTQRNSARFSARYYSPTNSPSINPNERISSKLQISPFPGPQSKSIEDAYHLLVEPHDLDIILNEDLNDRQSYKKISNVELISSKKRENKIKTIQELSVSVALDIEQNKKNEARMGYEAVSYSLLFTFCFAIFSILRRMYLDTKRQIFDDYVESIFIFMRFIVLIFQFLLTRIGRKCDELISRKDRFNCFISIEYLMEWYCVCTYYIAFRWICCYHIDNFVTFAILLCIHILSEMPLSLKLLNAYKIFDTRSNDNSACHELFFDISSFDEWTNRCCMDLVLRFYASILSTIVQCIILLSVNWRDFHINYLYDEQYHAVLGYIFLSNVYELIHFCFLYMFSEKNVLRPFINYMTSMTAAHQFIHLTVFATVLVVLLA